MDFNLIVAQQADRGIGKDNKIPWYVPEDLNYFSKITQENQDNRKNVVVMGRKTWESIPLTQRPLKNRVNIILSRTATNNNPIDTPDTLFFQNMKDLFTYFRKQYQKQTLGKIFIIGGESIYNYFLENVGVQTIYVTNIFTNYECDTYFPNLNKFKNYYQLSHCGEVLTSRKHVEYQFMTYTLYPNNTSGLYIMDDNPNIGEYQYLNLINKIKESGIKRCDRTGIGTRSIFGTQIRFDLNESFPLLTTKKMFLRGIIEELLWFLRGETDAKTLQDKKVRIWDGNSSREYLDSIGLNDNREGDCGPIYGHNFRHYGAKYINCDTNYQGQGYDQVAEAIRLIKEEPTSRRILINLWNPCDLDKVALPPCHVLYQFYVDGDNLSCSMYQRSGDIGLGVPFNIASASLMTYVFAKLTGKRPKELIHTIGDAHIYENHLQALLPQLTRTPYPFPILNIKDRQQKNIEDFIVTDFKLEGYQSHPSIKMDMAI